LEIGRGGREGRKGREGVGTEGGMRREGSVRERKRASEGGREDRERLDLDICAGGCEFLVTPLVGWLVAVRWCS